MHANNILEKWRAAITHDVSEGEMYEAYSKFYLPTSKVQRDAEKLVMKIVDFQVELPAKMTKEQKTMKVTKGIVGSTKITEPIQVTYLNHDDDTTKSNNNNPVSGTAVKASNNEWTVFLFNKP
jgi:hypothetical protein